jgi:hypothetical protein
MNPKPGDAGSPQTCSGNNIPTSTTMAQHQGPIGPVTGNVEYLCYGPGNEHQDGSGNTVIAAVDENGVESCPSSTFSELGTIPAKGWQFYCQDIIEDNPTGSPYPATIGSFTVPGTPGTYYGAYCANDGNGVLQEDPSSSTGTPTSTTNTPTVPTTVVGAGAINAISVAAAKACDQLGGSPFSGNSNYADSAVCEDVPYIGSDGAKYRDNFPFTALGVSTTDIYGNPPGSLAGGFSATRQECQSGDYPEANPGVNTPGVWNSQFELCQP